MGGAVQGPLIFRGKMGLSALARNARYEAASLRAWDERLACHRSAKSGPMKGFATVLLESIDVGAGTLVLAA